MHLLNFVWPNIFEVSPHVINAVTEAIEGLKLISAKLESFLKSQGIEEIQTEVYDEDLHEVISIMPSEVERVVDIVSKGYTLNGKPFRYPKIILGRNA